MYTHLFYGPLAAKKIYEAFSYESLGREQSFEAAFPPEVTKGKAYLTQFDAHLQSERHGKYFVVRFNDYLAEIPAELLELDLPLIKAQLVRMNSAPTQARAGLYEDPQNCIEARVDRILPSQHMPRADQVPLYAQNLTVTGLTLESVLDFHSKLSTGSAYKFLKSPWE